MPRFPLLPLKRHSFQRGASVMLVVFVLLAAPAEAPVRQLPVRDAAPVQVDKVAPDPNLDILAALIQAEAGGEPYAGKVAVAAVVLNRVSDERWPDSIEAVIHQPGQFCPSGNLPEPSDEARRAAREAWEGADPTGGAVYFYNPATARCGWIVTRETVREIGGHRFAR